MTRPCIGPHEWMANPAILIFDEPLDQIPPYVCRSCDAVGEDCVDCDTTGRLDHDDARCPTCRGTGIMEQGEVDPS